MREVIRFCFKLILCLLLALGAGFGYLAVQSGDPIYTFYEWMSPARFKQYDGLIRLVALEHRLDPMLVKAVVWRESRFDPNKNGSAGERGLMQVSEKAAREWARENKIDNFHVEKLFDPKTNLEQGRGICAVPLNTGKRNRTRCPSRLPNTMLVPVERNDGAVEIASLRSRRAHSSKGSISLERGSMSIQSSHVTNSTNDAGECDLYPPVCRRCGK